MTNESIQSVDVSSSAAPSPASSFDTSSTQTGSTNTQAPKVQPFTSDQQELINAIARDAHERGAKKERQLFENQTRNYQLPRENSNNFSLDEIKRIASEEADRKLQDKLNEQYQLQMQANADLFVNQFKQKLQSGAAKYPDFAQKVGSVDLSKMVDLVQMTSALDNTADVMYDLANNPYKIATLQQLAAMQPQLAYSEIQKLSASIKANQAPKPPEPNAPLSQLNASPIGVNSDGLPDIDYFSKKYRA